MDFSILNPEIQQFINDNTGTDISRLALRKNPFPKTDWPEILNQVAAKTKAKHKLPSWFSTENIIYPAKISIEQTSSEKTALHKSGLISGESLVDLTGGFGVDDYYFCRNFKKVTHCEINEELSEIVRRNFESLEIGNIECKTGDSTEILKNLGHSDWIYVDPSRRNQAKGKVFMLKDCLPDVPELLDFYFSNTDNILIKTAPILDISAGLGELKNVKRIHVVALENEVKELLWELSKGFSGGIEVKTANILKEKTEIFDFLQSENSLPAPVGLPEKYLYEPNGAIMKSGGFNSISRPFMLKKLHPHSHLYTGEELIDFPGRAFEILESIPYSKNEMKRLQGIKANVTTRNFPETVESLRRKWKIREGGEQYCFFTTDAGNRKIVLICSKINNR